MKYNRRNVMLNAWRMIRTMGMSRSAALKAAWATEKASSGLQQLYMKDWFANKVAREIKHNLHDSDIFAVLRETEKAMYCMLSIEPGCNRCVWIPKSCIETAPGCIDFHTRMGLTFEQAVTESRYFWSSYC